MMSLSKHDLQLVAAQDDPLGELAEILHQLGPIADRLASRAVVAQYEADIGDPTRTRAGTALAGSIGPLPRFLPARDILRINVTRHALAAGDEIAMR